MERAIIFLLCTFVSVCAEPNNINIVSEPWQSTAICRRCRCEAGVVTCADRGLTEFFRYDQWKLIRDMQPSTVDLSGNKLSVITSIAELPLQALNLSRCGVETIESDTFQNLQQMTTLDLSYNKLATPNLSPRTFMGRFFFDKYEPLVSMRTLSLAYNELHSLHQDLFKHLSKLTELDLSGNALTTIDHNTLIAISSLPMLKVLRMRSCQLTEIPEKFLHTLRSLERLDVSDNKLTAVPQQLQEAKNLIYLNLNQNPIVELDITSKENPGFPRLQKLKELHMSHMTELRRIGGGALAGLENLQALHLNHNPRLSHLDAEALARPDEEGEMVHRPLVKELYLQSNNLSEINFRLLSRWDVVDHVDVSDNPFLCDCSTQWMVDHLVPTVEATSANAAENMICAVPPKMAGYTMKHLHDIHRVMRCDHKRGRRPKRDTFSINEQLGIIGVRDKTITGNHEYTFNGNSQYTLNGPIRISFVGNNQFTLSGDSSYNQTGYNVIIFTGNNRFTTYGNNHFIVDNDSQYTMTGNNEFMLNGNNQFTVTGSNMFTFTGNNEFTVTGNNRFILNGRNQYIFKGNQQFTLLGKNELTLNGVRRDDLFDSLT